MVPNYGSNKSIQPETVMPSAAAVQVYPFRNRGSIYVVFSVITREPLKIRQVKHCKKGFCEIFQMSEQNVCLPSKFLGKLRNFVFFACFGHILVIFKKKFLTPTFQLFGNVFLVSTA